jgi:hypothetical protein
LRLEIARFNSRAPAGEFAKAPVTPRRFTDRRGLDQARRSIAWVGDWISKAFERPISVSPLLALHGWFVERRRKLLVTV